MTTQEREVMQMALEALEYPGPSWLESRQKAAESLRAALAQPEQEPVAYLCENAVGHKYFRWKKPTSVFKPIPLYTAPPQREWVGLTPEEAREISLANRPYVVDMIAALEARLKEKNT